MIARVWSPHLLAASVAALLVAGADGWRTAALALAAAAAVAATRVRFANDAAVVLLALVAVLVAGGNGIGG